MDIQEAIKQLREFIGMEAASAQADVKDLNARAEVAGLATKAEVEGVAPAIKAVSDAVAKLETKVDGVAEAQKAAALKAEVETLKGEIETLKETLKTSIAGLKSEQDAALGRAVTGIEDIKKFVQGVGLRKFEGAKANDEQKKAEEDTEAKMKEGKGERHTGLRKHTY